MSVLSKVEFLDTLKNRIGESNSDEDIKFLEDMTDTYDDLAKAKGNSNSDNENWKEKYEQLDKEWKEKYKQRFFDTSTKDEVEEQDDNKDQITIDDLFISKGD